MEEENQIKEQKKNMIYDYLRQGMSKKDAAIMSGISEATFYRWLEDESFESRVEASILEYKHTLVKNVNISTEKDGRLALEVLKRRYPKEWGENVETHNTYEKERKNVGELLQAIFDRNDDEELPETTKIVQDPALKSC
jgi:transposase